MHVLENGVLSGESLDCIVLYCCLVYSFDKPKHKLYINIFLLISTVLQMVQKCLTHWMKTKKKKQQENMTLDNFLHFCIGTFFADQVELTKDPTPCILIFHVVTLPYTAIFFLDPPP